MDWNKLFENFKKQKILVLGDVMLDAYLYGSVTRISPEAPVPIINYSKSENRLGGAANVALNIASMGAQAIMLSVVGDDDEAATMCSLLRENQINASGIIRSPQRVTTVKTRVIGNKQHLLRIDKEIVDPINAQEERQLLEKLESFCEEGLDAIIFEDYNKGLLTKGLIEKSIALALKYKIPTCVDPKKENFLSYEGVNLFKPNFKELKEGVDLNFTFQKGEIFEDAVKSLREKLRAQYVFVTLSEHGVYIQSEKDSCYIDAHYRTISDVSGAGDTVISIATLCLAAKLAPESIAKIANLAGGLVCEEIGVVPINATNLLDEITKNDF